MLTRLRSGRIHPDAAAPAEEGQRSLARMTSAKSFRRQDSGKSEAQRELERSLAMPEEEYNEWLQDKVKHDGRRGALDVSKFYLRMLKPCVLVTVYVEAIYAGISWAVPNILCNTIAKQNSGSLVSGQCIYIDVGKEGYSTHTGSKVFFLLFWTLEAGWGTGFCAFITTILFGPAFKRRERIAVCSVMVLVMLTNLVAGPRFGYAMNSQAIVGGIGVASILTLFLTMNAPMRYTANPLNRLRWIAMLLLTSAVYNIYLFLIPMAITARSSDAFNGMGITFVRLVVHPAMWSAILMSFRFNLRNIGYIKEMRSSILLTWPLIYSSLYGRFLLLQMDSAGSVVLVNLLIAFVSTASRLSDRSSDGLLLKLMYGEKARDAMAATRDQDEKHMAEVFMETMTDLTSIFAASCILSLGGVATKAATPPSHGAIWISAALQAVTTLAQGFIGMAMEGKFHCFEWSRAYTTAPVRITLMILVMMTFGASRLCMEIIAIFCPTYYPDRDIILLEQCDKPSLFQAISVSSADHFKMIGSFFSYTDGAPNVPASS